MGRQLRGAAARGAEPHLREAERLREAATGAAAGGRAAARGSHARCAEVQERAEACSSRSRALREAVVERLECLEDSARLAEAEIHKAAAARIDALHQQQRDHMTTEMRLLVGETQTSWSRVGLEAFPLRRRPRC